MDDVPNGEQMSNWTKVDSEPGGISDGMDNIWDMRARSPDNMMPTDTNAGGMDDETGMYTFLKSTDGNNERNTVIKSNDMSRFVYAEDRTVRGWQLADDGDDKETVKWYPENVILYGWLVMIFISLVASFVCLGLGGNMNARIAGVPLAVLLGPLYWIYFAVLRHKGEYGVLSKVA